MALIVAVLWSIALLAPLFFDRLKLPGILGLIVTGIIISPHGLGVLEREGEVAFLGTVG